MKRKDRTAEKRQPIPSGLAGTAPRRRAFGLVFRVVLVVFVAACAWLRRASARRTCLCQAHATVPILLLYCTRFSSLPSTRHGANLTSLLYTVLVFVFAKHTPRCQSYFFTVHGSRLCLCLCQAHATVPILLLYCTRFSQHLYYFRFIFPVY